MTQNFSDSMLQSIFESAASPIITITSSGIITRTNPATTRLFGFTDAEMIGQNISILVPEPHKGRHDGYLHSYLTTGVKKIIGSGRELEAQAKNGKLFPIHLSVSEFRQGDEIFFVGMISDLSAVKQAIAKTEAVIEAAIAPVITIDDRGIIETINEATTQLFGYAPEEVIGKNVSMLMPSPHRQNHDSYLRAYRETGDRKVIGIGREVDAAHKNGRLIPIHLSVSEFFVDQKRYFVGIISDLTKVKQAQSDLGRLNDELSAKTWVQEGQIGLYELLSVDSDLITVASNVCQFICSYLDIPVSMLYRCNDEQMAAEYLTGYCPPSQGARQTFQKGEGTVGQVLASRKSTRTSIKESPIVLETSLGTSTLTEVGTYPILSGKIILGVFEFAAPEPLSEQKLEFIGQAMDSVGLSFHLKLNDQRVRGLLSETRKQSADLRAQQEELKATNEELQASEEELKAQQEELRVANEELQVKSQALQQEKDRLTDKTVQLERAQNLLEERAREVAEASRYKSEFLANMSHELRTPLNSILMISQSMSENRKGNLSARQVTNMLTIQNAGQDLLNLISDILDLSKVEAGKLKIETSIVELRSLVQNILNLIQPLADQKNLQFTVSLTSSAPESIETDRSRLDQILRNLLSNAVKFTENGRVQLVISGEENVVSFAVSDTGIGIPVDQQETVFRAFQQIDGKTTRQFGGTGLGLSITKELAALLGGEIVLESKVGTGSTFTLKIPVRFAEPVAEKSSQRAPEIPFVPDRPRAASFDDRDQIQLGDRVILIVEDDPTTGKLILDYCHEQGVKGVIASDGISGVRLAEDLRPSGIIMDLGLPRLSGLEAIDLIKANPVTQHIPIQAISGSDSSQASKGHGAIGFMQKPLQRDQVQSVLNRLDSLAPRKIRRLLVVEDDSRQRRAISELLRAPDLEIVEAKSGSEAFDQILISPPQCIILDFNLPDMSGADFLEKLQARFSQDMPPIIVYTGRELSDAELEKLEVYSKSIIIKGAMSPDRLVSEATMFLHRMEKDLSEPQRKLLRDLRDPGRILSGKTILVVDDDVRNRYSLQEALEDSGVNIVSAKNGQEAIDIYREDPKKFHLVLMDMMMPVLDGYEATRQLKALNKRVPVIALTARAMKGEREKCLLSGCDDYISKPINTDQLLSLLRVWLYAVD